MALPACRLAPSRPACSPACSRSRLARAALARSERRRLAGFPPCRAAGGGAGSGKEVYYGRYGPWSVEREDLVEVWGYRAGLSAAALSALAASGAALLPAGDLRDEMTRLLDPLFIFGSAGLGVSLQLIHIYVDPLKKALQLFWALGTAGAMYLMASHDEPAAVFVAQHAWATWLVGPFFAALTGVAFKEGLCYGKPEAAGLFGAVPLLVGGHLLHLWSPDAERPLLGAVICLLAVFAGRKYTQPVKDDIGDKSVFEFRKLSDAQQAATLAALTGGTRQQVLSENEVLPPPSSS